MKIENSEEFVRETYSVCPKCLNKIKAKILRQGNSIYMKKECKIHGHFKSLISNQAKDYTGLDRLYFNLNNKKLTNQPKYYNLVLTMKCNLDCPICFLDPHKINKNNSYKEPSLKEIKVIVRKLKQTKIGLWGGEPTLRPDLVDIIKIIRRSGNIPVLYTNGIKLNDFTLLKKLKLAGLDTVHLQFDGFEKSNYLGTRGKDLLQIKIQVLNNLRKLKIPTFLESIIVQNKSDVMEQIFEYAVNHDFIKGISLGTYSQLGKGKSYFKNSKYLSLDDIVDLFVKSTNNRITKREIIVFQKLFIVLSSLFKKQKCLYKYYFFVHRTKNKGDISYRSFKDMVSLNNVEKILREFEIHHTSKNFIQKYYALLRLFLSLINKHSLKMIKDFFLIFLNKERFTGSKISNKSLIVLLTTICDHNNYDFDKVRFCNGGEISTDYGTSLSLAEANMLRESQN